MSRDTKSFKLSTKLWASVKPRYKNICISCYCFVYKSVLAYFLIFERCLDSNPESWSVCNFLSDSMCYYLCVYLAMWSTALHMKPKLIGGPLLKPCLIGGHLIDSDMSPQLLPFKASHSLENGGSPRGNERTLYRVSFWYGGGGGG